MQFTCERYNYKYVSRINSIIIESRNLELLMESIQKQYQQEKIFRKEPLANVCSNVIMCTMAGNPADNRIF